MLGCNAVAIKASADPQGVLELGGLQNYPKPRQEGLGTPASTEGSVTWGKAAFFNRATPSSWER